MSGPASPASATAPGRLQAGMDAAAQPPVGRSRFTAPLQPWVSPAGDVHLLRPATVQPTTSSAPLGSLMGSGWRLVWDDTPVGPGAMVARLVLKVTPAPPQQAAQEVLQVAVSRAPGAVRDCLTAGLAGDSGRREPDRIINRRRYAVWTHRAAGMSQQIAATDLRAVVGGACYAIARFQYGEMASDPDPSAAPPQAQGAAELDASLASLQIGPLAPGQAIRPPRVVTPPDAVAR